MVVDASALIAILTRDQRADLLADRLEAARSPITGAVAVFEAALGLCRQRHSSVDEARGDVRELLDIARVHVLSLTAKEADLALEAFGRYGAGGRHPAQLDLGACFSYALARSYNTTLLFTCPGLSLTDVRDALDPR